MLLVIAGGYGSECCEQGPRINETLWVTLGTITVACALVQLLMLAGSPMVAVAGNALAALPQLVSLFVALGDPGFATAQALVWALPLPLLAIATWRASAAHSRDRMSNSAGSDSLSS